MSKSLIAGLLSVVVFGAAHAAQTMSVLAPVRPQYRLGDFEYKPPSADGWRQVTSAESSFVLVYAETVPPDQVHTRIQVDAEAFAIPDPKVVQDLVWLTEQGQAQQVKERGDKLIAFSKIGAIASNEKVLSYALVTRIGDEDLHEVFYVMLAPDKSSYLVAKLATKEPDHRAQIYFSQFEASLGSLVHKPASAPEPEKDSAPAAPSPLEGT